MTGKAIAHHMQAIFAEYGWPDTLLIDSLCARAQSISQRADAGQLNIPPSQQPGHI